MRLARGRTVATEQNGAQEPRFLALELGRMLALSTEVGAWVRKPGFFGRWWEKGATMDKQYLPVRKEQGTGVQTKLRST